MLIPSSSVFFTKLYLSHRILDSSPMSMSCTDPSPRFLVPGWPTGSHPHINANHLTPDQQTTLTYFYMESSGLACQLITSSSAFPTTLCLSHRIIDSSPVSLSRMDPSPLSLVPGWPMGSHSCINANHLALDQPRTLAYFSME